jgi:hydrogenase maturation protein HypF
VYRSFVSFFGSDKDFVYEFLKDKIDLNRVDIIFSLGEKNINTFYTSSCGRIFDAVGVLVCGDLYSNFEAEIAMKLEHIAYGNRVDERYSFDLTREKDGYVIEWEGLVRDIIKDWRNKKSNVISSKFHNSIIYLIKEMVEKLSIEYQINDVCFSGGVFQNRYLLNGILKILGGRYNIFFNSKTPSNDGCISLGQIYYYLNFLTRKD